MPPVLIPIITAAGVSGGITIGASTITYASLIAYGLTAAGALGASFLLSGRQREQKGASQQVTVKQALPPRTRSYGRVKLAGAIGFLETGGPGALYRLVVHGEGEWDAIEEWWLNDVNANLAGGAVTVLPWGSNITIESHLGGAGQTVSPMLSADFGSVWTADHRLRGLAYSVMRCGWVPEKHFSKVYPNGVPELRVVARAAKVFDPRNGLTAWTRNPALCIRDHLAHADGLRIDPAMIDAASFAAFADLCDQPVALAAGGAEPRYSVDLTYDLTEAPREVHRRLLQACDAEIYPTAEGRIGIRGGVYEEPAVTLTEEHVTSYRYESGHDRLAAFNHLKLTCTNPLADYQPVELDPWEDLASQAEVGVLQQDLALTQVSSWTQARRLGKIALHRGNPQHKLTLQTGPAAVIALGERSVRVTLAELDLDAAFLVERCELRFDGTQLVGCALTLSSITTEAYAWTTAQEGAAPVTPAATGQTAAPPQPTGLTLSLVRTEATAGVFMVRIRATVDPLAGTPWQTIGRYRELGASDWIEMVSDGDWAVTTSVLRDGTVFEVQAAHSGFGGAASGTIGPWTDPQTITTVADASAPDLPSGLGVSPGAGTATVSWFAPTSINFVYSLVYRGTIDHFGSAAQVGQLFGTPGQLLQHPETLDPGTYYWWVVAVNRSGVASDPVGSVSGAVT